MIVCIRESSSGCQVLKRHKLDSFNQPISEYNTGCIALLASHYCTLWQKEQEHSNSVAGENSNL